MELAPALAGDIGLYARLIRVFYEQEPGLAPLSDEEARAKAGRLFEAAGQGRAFPLLLRQAGDIVGYALVSPYFSCEYDGLVGLLDEYLILPEYQGKGLGGAFLDLLKDWAPARGLARLSLEVTDKNPGVIRLYARKGFVPLTRRLMAWDAGK